jgi:hypothetical protein
MLLARGTVGLQLDILVAVNVGRVTGAWRGKRPKSRAGETVLQLPGVVRHLAVSREEDQDFGQGCGPLPRVA